MFGGGALLSPLERVCYLQADFDLLGECARLEDGLHLGDDRAGDHAALGADSVHLRRGDAEDVGSSAAGKTERLHANDDN